MMSDSSIKIHISQLLGGSKAWSTQLIIETSKQCAGLEIELYYQGEQKVHGQLDDAGYMAVELNKLSPPSDLSSQVFFEVCFSNKRQQKFRSKSFHPPLVMNALRAHLESAKTWPKELALRGADLEDIKLDRADLRGVDFTGSNLSRVSLIGAQLEGAILREVLLKDADLTGADLTSVDLQDALIHGSTLKGAIFIGANFKGLRGIKLHDLKLIADQIIMDDRQMKAMSLSVELELKEEREKQNRTNAATHLPQSKETSTYGSYSSNYSRTNYNQSSVVMTADEPVDDALPPERLGAAIREQIEEKEQRRAISLARYTQKREIRNGLVIELKLIPEGKFIMGTGQGEEHARPRHEVTLTQPFYLMSTLVTQRLYEAVMGQAPFKFPHPDHPAESVSWSDAIEFCNRLSSFESLEPVYKVSLKGGVVRNPKATGYRLPTEAEWEYAARTNNSYIYAGGDELDEVGWHKGNANGHPHPVGQKKPNSWGLYDMSGNVWEWCFDLYQENVYRQRKNILCQDPVADIKHGIDGPRVIRGGSWSYESEGAQVSYRSRLASHFKTSRIGFRVARSPKMKQ